VAENTTVDIKSVDWILRIAMCGEFLGHGILAVMQKKKFVDMFVGMGALIGLTISSTAAGQWVFWIGLLDVIVAIAILFKPLRIILIWGIFWAFMTAIARPLASPDGWNIFATILDANKDNFWDFIERFANIGVPLALLYIRGLPKTVKDLFE